MSMEQTERQADQQRMAALGRGHQLTTLLVTALFLFGVLVGLLRWMPSPEAPVQVSVEMAFLQQALAGQTVERIRTAIQIYRLTENHLPPDLEALAGRCCIEESDLKHPWFSDRFYYRRLGEADYILLPPSR